MTVRPPRLDRRVLWLTLGVVLAGCTGDGAAPTTTPTSPTTTETVEAPTSTPTSAPTSSSTDTTTLADTEAAVRAVHTRVFTEMFARDERVDGPEVMLPLAEELTTGPLLARIKERIEERKANGERSAGPGYVSHILSVEIDGEAATVVDCSLGRGERYSAAGELLIPADEYFKLRESQLVQVDGRWLVEEIFSGGDRRCTPPS